MKIPRGWSDQVARGATIILRVDEEQEGRLEEAAGRAGKTLTSFLLECIERQVREFEKRSAARTGTRNGRRSGNPGACPGFFRLT
jgi:predicted DNA-binding protein